MSKKLWIEQFGAVEYAENHTDNSYTWEDKTSDALAWDLYGKQIMDYLFYRDKINQILIPKSNPNYPIIDFSGWGNLTNSEREIMSRYVLAPYQLRLTIFNDIEDKKHWGDLIKITQGNQGDKNILTGRAKLIEDMRAHVADKVRIEQLTMSQSQEFYKDVSSLLDWYINSASPDFKLWLYGQNPYVGVFENKSYYSEDLKNQLINLYETGGY